MIANKRKFYMGLVGLGLFVILLVVMFMPVFSGKNAFAYSDELFNEISKDSSYQVPGLQEDSQEYIGKSIEVTVGMEGDDQAQQTALLYQKAGAEATASGSNLSINGDLGTIVQSCLEDADAMYQNNGAAVSELYGYDEREVMYNWWKSFDKMGKALDEQGLEDEKKFVNDVKQDAIEPAYNFYQIEAQSISDRLGIVIFALVFYIFYTIWYGFSLMFLFEGFGLATKH